MEVSHGVIDGLILGWGFGLTKHDVSLGGLFFEKLRVIEAAEDDSDVWESLFDFVAFLFRSYETGVFIFWVFAVEGR